MITTTMGALLTGEYLSPDGEFLYIIRSGEDVMYIGRTVEPNRRMLEHYYNILYLFAKDNRRDVLRWSVELRTAEECREYIPEQYKSVTMQTAEPHTILALRPVLNTTYNTNRSPMPDRYKHLFQVNAGATDNLF